MSEPRNCPGCGREFADLPALVGRCPGCGLRDPLGTDARHRDRIRRLHDLDTRIVAGTAGALLALAWLSIRSGAWDWLLLLVPGTLILFALLPRR